MKIILVTSSVTYVPQNYDDVIGYLIQELKPHIQGVVIVNTAKPKIIFMPIYLFAAGCFGLSKSLAKNILNRRKKIKLLELNKLPFIKVDSINDKNSIQWLKEKNPDIIINLRTRCFYKEEVLAIPTLGCLNLHHGLLPNQRGLYCDLYAISRSDKTGITMHKMNKNIDDGEILFRFECPTNKNYIKYLSDVEEVEKNSVSEFIREVIQTESIPKGIINKGDNIEMTTTPKFQEIKQFQKKGIKL